jgi:hypothetical protein
VRACACAFDLAGMNFWLNAMAAGATLTQVAKAFVNSSESTALYPFLTLPNLVNASNFVTQVYNNLLNRAPDAPGLAFWTAELQSGAVTRIHARDETSGRRPLQLSGQRPQGAFAL